MYSFLSNVFNYHGRPYGKHELTVDKTCGKTYWGISVKVFLLKQEHKTGISSLACFSVLLCEDTIHGATAAIL